MDRPVGPALYQKQAQNQSGRAGQAVSGKKAPDLPTQGRYADQQVVFRHDFCFPSCWASGQRGSIHLKNDPTP